MRQSYKWAEVMFRHWNLGNLACLPSKGFRFMFNKLTLAAIVAVAGMMMGGSEAHADNCRYGRSNFSGYRSYAPPVYSSYRPSVRYAPPVRYGSPYRGYSSFSPYRSGFGGVGYGIGHPGYRSGFGYGSPFYGGGSYVGFGRGGVSIGFGF